MKTFLLLTFLAVGLAAASKPASPERQIHDTVSAVASEVDSQLKVHFNAAQKHRFRNGPLTASKTVSHQQFHTDMERETDKAAAAQLLELQQSRRRLIGSRAYRSQRRKLAMTSKTVLPQNYSPTDELHKVHAEFGVQEVAVPGEGVPLLSMKAGIEAEKKLLNDEKNPTVDQRPIKWTHAAGSGFAQSTLSPPLEKL